MRTVTVTGGAGFIGTNLVRSLLVDDRVSTVRVLDDLSSGRLINLEGLEVEFHRGDVRDPRAVTRALDGADAVVHLAARVSVEASMRDPLVTHDVNVTGTLQVLEAARATGVATVVLASSCAVYGDTSGATSEQAPTAPLSPYAASKAAAESYGIAYGAGGGPAVLALRFYNVFGPGQRVDGGYAAVVPRFCAAALACEPLPVHGDGRQTRDFVYVDDVCRVLRDGALGEVASSKPVNLGTGTSVSLHELILSLERIMGRRLDRQYRPARAGDVRDSFADVGRLRSLLPDFRPTALDIGLRRTIEWARRVSVDTTYAARPVEGVRR